jgi:uncharacterized protein (DUF4415 family)
MRKHGINEDIELTDDELSDLRPAHEVLAAGVLAQMGPRRGKQKTPTKMTISLRLDANVLDAYKATGNGWQSRMNECLAKHAPRRRRPKTTARARRVSR